MSLRVARSPHPVSAFLVPLLLVFLVLFPKGGVKFGGAPLTWGYLLIGITAVPLIAVRFLVLPLRFTPRALLAYASLLPFLLLFFYSCAANGLELPSYAVSVFANFCFLPAMFLLVYPPFLPMVSFRQFTRWFCFCVLATAIYGIFLFFLHPITGSYLEIPYLTVNAADYGLIELTKHIARGRFLKLISTYNNGNLYGATMLIVLPLFDLLEPVRWKRNVLRLALVLTLSRTIWVGLVLEQMLSLGAQLLLNVATFPRVRLGQAARRGLAVLGTILVAGSGVLFTGNALQLLTDRTFGGRSYEIAGTASSTWLPTVPVTGFSEVLYAGAAANYGYTGMVAVTLIFVAPLGLMLLDRRLLDAPSRRAALKGLILYALICASDGATNLIPVMVFYWFAYMTFLHGLPGESASVDAPQLARSRPRRSVRLAEAAGL